MKISKSSGFAAVLAMSAMATAAQAQLAPVYSNASLRGTYVLTGYSFDSDAQQPVPVAGIPLKPPRGFTSVFGTATFDGTGNVRFSVTGNQDGVTAAGTLTCTYAVSANGAFTTGGADCEVRGTLVEDGKIAVGTGNSGQDPEVLLFVRQQGQQANVASGPNVLNANTTGVTNTAVGAYALAGNTTGSGNNALGYQAMYSNLTGINNLAIGGQALLNWSGANTDVSVVGRGNNAIGLNALSSMTAGQRNTAVGNNAGLYLRQGAYNTYIGWQVTPGTGVPVNEDYVTRIGVTYNDPNIQPYSPKTYIAGISNSQVTGAAVYVTASGQLGVLASSEQYKTDIHPLDGNTEKLSQLRPVSFHLKTEPNGVVQYGLIAEEVDKVYPELVIRDSDGKIQGVRYDQLAPILLGEVRQQSAKIASLEQKVAEVDELKQKLSTVIQELKERDKLVTHH